MNISKSNGGRRATWGWRCALCALAGAFVLTPCALAQEDAKESAPAAKRPKFQNLRYEEDWSQVDRFGDSDFWDRLKHIQLDEEGDVRLSIGGQARFRLESWSNFGFGGPGNRDDEFLLTRLRVHTDLRVGDYFRVFLEGKSALSTDRDLPGGKRAALDVDTAALQNGFADVTFELWDGGTFTFRAGRQELQFGKQRLVSPLNWSNNRRTFDGVRGILRYGDWKIEPFFARFVRNRKYSANDHNTGTDLFGIYATGKFPGSNLDLDLYWLGLDRDMSTFGGVTGAEERHTFGFRLGGKIGKSGFYFDLESAVQFGDHGTRDISAYMASSVLGYAFADASWKPRLEIGFDYASGDDNPADGDVETFNQLFPLGHAYLGFIDAVGRQNNVDARVSLYLKPMKKLTVRADVHFFWLANSNDALYNAGGGVLRVGGADEEVGQEFDLTIKYVIDAHTVVSAGYSHFFAGDFIGQTGVDDDIDTFYIQIQYTF